MLKNTSKKYPTSRLSRIGHSTPQTIWKTKPFATTRQTMWCTLIKMRAKVIGISLDWITQLLPSRHRDREYDSILTIVDRYTKMAIFVTVESTMDSVDFTRTFYHSLVNRKLSTAFHKPS